MSESLASFKNCPGIWNVGFLLRLKLHERLAFFICLVITCLVTFVDVASDDRDREMDNLQHSFVPSESSMADPNPQLPSGWSAEWYGSLGILLYRR